MSSEFKILYSLPFSLISVPPYLLINTRSPFLTSNGSFLPLSSVLPVPSATTSPSVGFSRSEEHTSELQSHSDLVCRLLLEKKKKKTPFTTVNQYTWPPILYIV